MKRLTADNKQSREPKSQVGNDLVIQRSSYHRGPLPSPEVLQRYDEIMPGAAERIIAMAEKQAEHRRTLEAQVIRSDVSNAKLGLMFGFIIGFTGVGGGILAIILGRQGVGTLISVLSLGTLVTAFVYGSQQRRREREEKDRSSTGAEKAA